MTVRLNEGEVLETDDGRLVVFDASKLKELLDAMGLSFDEFVNEAEGKCAKIQNRGALGLDIAQAVSKSGLVHDCLMVGAPHAKEFERMLRADELHPYEFTNKLRSSDELYEHFKTEEAISDFIDKAYSNYIKTGEIKTVPFDVTSRHNPDLDDVFMNEGR